MKKAIVLSLALSAGTLSIRDRPMSNRRKRRKSSEVWRGRYWKQQKKRCRQKRCVVNRWTKGRKIKSNQQRIAQQRNGGLNVRTRWEMAGMPVKPEEIVLRILPTYKLREPKFTAFVFCLINDKAGSLEPFKLRASEYCLVTSGWQLVWSDDSGILSSILNSSNKRLFVLLFHLTSPEIFRQSIHWIL